MHRPIFDVTSLSRIETAAQIMAAVALLLVLNLGLLTALLSGLLIYQLVHFAIPLVRALGVTHGLVKTVALSIPVIIICVALAFGIIKLMAFMTGGFDGVIGLLQMMAEVIDAARSYVPVWALDYLPANIEEFQNGAAQWLREHAGQIGIISQDVGKVLFYVLIGLIIGAIVAVQTEKRDKEPGPLAQAMERRADILSGAFRNIVFSQIRISALNTTLTGIYLAIVLPLLGIELPLVKTMIAVTFIAGLLPVLGNLISNTVIVVVSLSVSPYVAAGSLAFLVIIHKLEYFVNARIIGSRIKARAWELLIAMLVMEACFGLAGLIAAPIYYAYLKDELTARGLL